jgi:hypothetical protein
VDGLLEFINFVRKWFSSTQNVVAS